MRKISRNIGKKEKEKSLIEEGGAKKERKMPSRKGTLGGIVKKDSKKGKNTERIQNKHLKILYGIFRVVEMATVAIEKMRIVFFFLFLEEELRGGGSEHDFEV